MFENSTDEKLLFSHFIYDISTGKGKLLDNSYIGMPKGSTSWFDKNGFKSAVDAYLIKKQARNKPKDKTNM